MGKAWKAAHGKSEIFLLGSDLQDILSRETRRDCLAAKWAVLDTAPIIVVDLHGERDSIQR